MSTAAIETDRLTRRYGARDVVHNLTLSVPTGSIYALLGPNGAGKTTTIKMLMNIVPPSHGAATLLAHPSRRLGPQQLRRIGYVSENQDQPGWMTVGELIDYYRPFYPSWDLALGRRLLEAFELPRNQKLRNLSRGMQVKTALLTSLAYRPELLVLDEPFSGLDPLVREEVVRGVLELTAQERWTVFVSSHDIDEVERLADWVAVLDGGQLHLSEPLSHLQARFRRLEFRTASPEPLSAPPATRWTVVERAGQRVRLVDSDYRPGESEAALARTFGQTDELLVEPLSLREILVALARRFRLVGAERQGGQP